MSRRIKLSFASAQCLREVVGDIDRFLSESYAGEIDEEDLYRTLGWAYSRIAQAWHMRDFSDEDEENLTDDQRTWMWKCLPRLNILFRFVSDEARCPPEGVSSAKLLAELLADLEQEISQTQKSNDEQSREQAE